MAKIKKLKENGATIYPATIPEAVVDPNNKTKLSEIIDDLALTFGDPGESKNIIQAMSDLRSTIGEHSESGLDGYAQYLNLFIDKVNAFLEDADASDATINRWKEIESFLAGITDTETLTGLLAENLQSAKGYADTKVQQGTANAVTMSSNAGAADRVLTSAGSNKTAKDSGVSIGDLAKKDLSNVGEENLRSKGVHPERVIEIGHGEDGNITVTTDLADVRTFMEDAGTYKDPIYVSDGFRLLPASAIVSNDSYYLVFLDSSSLGAEIYSLYFTNDDGFSLRSQKRYALSDFLTGVPVATGSALGGVKSGGDITVGSDGAVKVNQATKATQDKNGADIAATYLKSAAVTDVTEYAEITI